VRLFARRRQRRRERDEYEALKDSDWFDATWYLKMYPNIAETGVDPLTHYLRCGVAEGYDPSAGFSTEKYLSENPDVASSRMNPLFHFVVYGRLEGRSSWKVIGSRSGVRLKQDPSATTVTDTDLRNFSRYSERPLLRSQSQFDPRHMNLHWVLPDWGVGGGGHMTIFRMVRWLELFGHKCTIWRLDPQSDRSDQFAHDLIARHYQTIRADVRSVDDSFFETQADAVIATGWQTAPVVSHAPGFRRRFYFVQDFEPAFYPVGDHSLAAEETYRLDLDCICAGPWLEQKMSERGRWARSFHLATDESVYNSHRADAGPLPKIAFYCRESSRRAVELGLLALELLAKRGLEFEVHLFGRAAPLFDGAPFAAVHHGVLPPHDLARLYNECLVGMCFSATNYSLIPQEMMACGCAVLELDGESTRTVFPAGIVSMARPHPARIADGLERLIRDPEARTRQVEAATKWVSQFSWEKSAQIVEDVIADRLIELGHRTAPAIHRGLDAKVTVVIPTYNGGELLKRVIDCVRSQRAPWEFKLFIIDSSSNDGTAEFCQAATDIQFKSIPKSEFGHGRTRNLAVSLCNTEFIAFLTQDALPKDEFWLYNLVTALDRQDDAAGAFGRHEASPEASPFTTRDIDDHFERFLSRPFVVSKETDRALWKSGDIKWRQFLHFYSDNNSCLRRSVWERLPMPDIEYGEDQVWAQQFIEAGYSKVYAHSAVVIHSHDYDPEEARLRAFTEAKFFAKEFGYSIVNPDNCKSEIAARNRRDRFWAAEHEIAEHELMQRMIINEATVYGAADALRPNQRGTSAKFGPIR